MLCGTYGCHSSPSERPIRLGEQYQARLDKSDPIRVEPPRGPEHRWVFDGQARQKVTIVAESYDCDTYLLLVDSRGRQIAWGDDNGGLFNPRIVTTLPATGRYTVIVCGANADQYGTYWLSFTEGDHVGTDSSLYPLAYYQRGIEWAEQKKNQRAVSWLNLAMGKYFRERRQWAQAEEHYAQSLAAAERAGFWYGQWAVTLERGTLLTQRMRFDQAVAELHRARELSKKLRAADQAEAAVLTQLGDLYCYIQREDLADVYYRTATRQAEQSGRPSALVRVYSSLCKFLLGRDKEKAVEYAHKAYALRDGLDPELNLTATYALAYVYLMSDRFEEGFKLATEIRRTAQRLGCRDKEIAILVDMSLVYGQLNKVEELIRFAREAAELISPDDEDPNPRRMALQIQADGEMMRGNHEVALGLCVNALQTTEAAWVRESIKELRQRYLSQSKAICTQILKNLNALNARYSRSEYARQAFDFAERSRSRVLLDELVDADARSQSDGDAQLLEQEGGLLEQISAVGRQIALAHVGSSVNPVELDQLEEQRAWLVGQRMQLEAQLRRLAADRNHAAQLPPLTAEQVQRKFLAAYPNAVILFYQAGVQESFLIVLTREDAHLIKLPRWSTIRSAVAEWQAQIRRQLNPGEDTAQAAQAYGRIAYQLYEMLIRPAARLLRGCDLIIVPDAALHHLAFEGLVVSAPGRAKDFNQLHYLVEDHAVTYAPSISVLTWIGTRQARPEAKTEKRLLLAGDAVFNEHGPQIVQSQPEQQEPTTELAMVHGPRLREGFYPLPATRDEVLSIARLAEGIQWKPKILLGPEANERNFRTDDLTSYRLVHLATHAIADPAEGDFSGVVLSATGDKSGDDGLLTAAEVARLRLNADLVVLSGCTTGGGQTIKAEGVIGLSRAFLVAGARRVCASLWKVEDNSTGQLMANLYENLLKRKQPTSHALRQAKIQFLRNWAAPYFWAPFVLVGSPDEPLTRE
jgi:CHAT domain-containing protein